MAMQYDKEGYLKNLSDWNHKVAEDIAHQENITLTEQHWQIIEVLREFYHSKSLSPPMRVFVKLVRQLLGEDIGNSIALHILFPPSPAKIAAKIAGLPKPTHCL